MENYVRFQRGLLTNYQALENKSEDTLYFVYSEDSSTTALYLGERLIAGTGENSGVNSLQQLKDVLVSEIADKDILIYSEESKKWINVAFDAFIEEIESNVNFEDILSSSQTIEEIQNSLNDIEEDIKELEKEIQTKVTQTYTQVPNVDENSGKTITEDEFNSGTYYIYKDNEYIVAGEYQEDAIYYVQEVDEEGKPLFEQVPDTLLTPVDKNKLDALVIGDKGQVEISGTVNIQNVQGLNGYLTEQHFSNDVNNKLNYITSVDSNHFAVNEGKLNFVPVEGRLLTAADEEKINFIEAVNEKVFSIESIGDEVKKNTLQLKQVPPAALTNALGDLTTLPIVTLDSGETSQNVVDNINQIYNILTWGDMN